MTESRARAKSKHLPGSAVSKTYLHVYAIDIDLWISCIGLTVAADTQSKTPFRSELFHGSNPRR